ncbi:hypothetical protein [Sphingomonas sp.]|uniref:hypothetical protein n=1 Tax=Sphingomonas sp. TaxID=28214 RepID=UPI0025EF679E|nr:hypothetical protein [Sphingomonas sp.]
MKTFFLNKGRMTTPLQISAVASSGKGRRGVARHHGRTNKSGRHTGVARFPFDRVVVRRS